MGGYFTFRKLVTPHIMEVVHIIGILAVTVGAFAVGGRTDSELLGLGFFIVAQILWRLLCEGIVLFFSMHKALLDCRDNLRRISGEHDPNVCGACGVEFGSKDDAFCAKCGQKRGA